MIPVQITSDLLNQMIRKIRDDLKSLEGNEDLEQIDRHFKNTMLHLHALQTASNESDNNSSALNQLELTDGN